LVTLGVLIAVACAIPYLALTEGYERTMSSKKLPGKVVEIKGEKVLYSIYHKKASPGWHRAGWSRPRFTKDIPEKERAKLAVGQALEIRRGKPVLAVSRPTPLLLVGVAAGLLFAIWSFVAPILERRRLRAIQGDAVATLRFMLAKTRASKLMISLLALAATGFFVVVALAVEDAGTGEKIFIFALGGITLIAAVLTGLSAWKLRNPKKAALMVVVNERPDDVVWVYVQEVISSGISSYNVFVCCNDGERHQLNLRQLDPTIALESMQTLFPKAIFGYNNDLKKNYERSPHSFTTAAVRVLA
jgi:hypothetical protein